MKPFKTLSILAAVALCAVTGCSSTNISALMNAKADDHAYVIGDVMTPYGSGHFKRFNPNTNQSMTITTPDGVVVKIEPK